MDEYGDEGDDSAQPSSSDTETSDNGGVTISGWCGDGSIGNNERQKTKLTQRWTLVTTCLRRNQG